MKIVENKFFLTLRLSLSEIISEIGDLCIDEKLCCRSAKLYVRTSAVYASGRSMVFVALAYFMISHIQTYVC